MVLYDLRLEQMGMLLTQMLAYDQGENGAAVSGFAFRLPSFDHTSSPHSLRMTNAHPPSSATRRCLLTSAGCGRTLPTKEHSLE